MVVFYFNIYYMELKQSMCKNPWCKAHFYYESEEAPDNCYKCQSFDDDLSGGVTWSDKKYEGSRYDGQAHPISVNVKRSIEQRKSW